MTKKNTVPEERIDAAAGGAAGRSRSRTKRAGLIWPIARAHNALKVYSKRIGGDAPLYVSSGVDVALQNVIMAATAVCRRKGRKRITTVHVLEAMRGRRELNAVFPCVRYHSDVYEKQNEQLLLPAAHRPKRNVSTTTATAPATAS